MKRQIFSVFFLCFFLLACSKEELVEDDFTIKEFKEGEEIVLKNINGGEKTLIRTKKGFILKNEPEKIIMFDFFGTFCSPCKEEAALLSQYYQKNKNYLELIGLSHFENVSDEVVKKFAFDFSAYYFLSNMKINERLIAQMLKDIAYSSMEQLPFKVVLKDGEYQTLSDFWQKDNTKGVKFYLGKIPTAFMQNDLYRIMGARN